MYTPTLAQARAAGRAAPASSRSTARSWPTWRRPVSAYLKVAAGRDSFLLESVEGIEHVGRYSFIGARPREVLEIREDGTPPWRPRRRAAR